MTDGDPTTGLWNWALASDIDEEQVRTALTGVLGRPVVPFGGDGVLCDVYGVGGDFPTLCDVYLAPDEIAEPTAASAVAVRLGSAVLLPDETLNPSRYVLATPDGSLRRVHADDAETEDGVEHTNVRPCTGLDPDCTARKMAA